MSGNRGKHGREDRRVCRTKRRLKSALLELISERRYDAISISVQHRCGT